VSGGPPVTVLHEDDAFVVVDKPAGVPCQPTGAAVAEDLAARVEATLGEGAAPLRAHVSLDREASGVVAFARDKAASAVLAKELEGRPPRWTFLAAVDGWRGGDRLLRHHVAPARGAIRIVPGDEVGARAVSTRARVRERRGSRSILELEVVRGKPAQIRAQLAHERTPVAGDAQHGAPLAPRLMLHASRLELPHPRGEPASFEAPSPPVFDEWLAGAPWPETRAYVDAALARAGARRWALAHAHTLPRPTTAYRLVQGAADGLSGVAVDVYGDHVVAQLAVGRARVSEPLLLDALDALGFSGTYVKRRPRHASVIVDAKATGAAPPDPVRGAPTPEDPLEILEDGVPYLVRLGDGLSTGIFLDQRDNRRRVRESSRGAAVLNLFAYTCAFTVAAAVGGARRTLSIDASKAAIERGRAALAHAGHGGDVHELVVGDVFERLDALARAEDGGFDLVIVDPPTYSTTRRSRWRSGRDWVALTASVFRVVVAGGAVLACTNDRRLRPKSFERLLRDGARAAGRTVARVEHAPPPIDFAPPLGAHAHSKSVWLTVAG
jgi:23S rRNA (cytosine1962-C5)-methyltransferase